MQINPLWVSSPHQSACSLLPNTTDNPIATRASVLLFAIPAPSSFCLQLVEMCPAPLAVATKVHAQVSKGCWKWRPALRQFRHVRLATRENLRVAYFASAHAAGCAPPSALARLVCRPFRGRSGQPQSLVPGVPCADVAVSLHRRTDAPHCPETSPPQPHCITSRTTLCRGFDCSTARPAASSSFAAVELP